MAKQVRMRDAREAYNRGMEYLDYNEPHQAITAFTEAIDDDPTFAEAFYARGYAWSEEGDLEKATADYNRAIQLNPELTGAYHNREAAEKQKGLRPRGMGRTASTQSAH